MYKILMIDLDEAYLANVYSDAEIEKVFQMHSEVPHKMRVGGQSAARFARIRDNEITLWYKRINEYLKPIEGPIYVGMNFVYKRRFLNKLSTYNREKIKEISSCEYVGLTGVRQYIKKLENSKVYK